MADFPPDRRPPIAIAMEWVSRITSVSLMMVLPALAGWWCDSKFGTGPWLLIVGALAGVASGMSLLFRLVSSEKPRSGNDDL